jgi:DNA-directed RNA polymerase III subunit RPC1
MAHRHQQQQQEANREADGRLLKRLVTESTAPKRISHIQFGLMAADEVQSMSEFQLSSNVLFKKHSRLPAVNGVLDPRLGVSDKQTNCETCR